LYNGHVSIEQIESLSQQESQSSRQQNSDDWSHVENCDRCRSLVEKCRLVNVRLGKLASTHLPNRSAMTCPDQKTWFEVAAGALPDEESLGYLAHAATCDSCGQRLHTATQIFSEDLTSEEEEALAAIPQGRIAQKIPAKLHDLDSRSKTTPFWKSWRPAFVAAALATVIVGTFFLLPSRRDPATEASGHLEKAYAENRTLQLRFPGAPYARLEIPRSGESTPLSNSAIDLGKAAEEIAAGLRKAPEDPQWLLLEARLYVLHWKYEDALLILDKLPPPSEEALLTRGLAVFEKAERENNPSLYGTAQQLFAQVLQRQPDNTVALLNHAITCQKARMFECASRDLNRFLSREKDPGWASEAREILSQVNEKKTSTQ